MEQNGLPQKGRQFYSNSPPATFTNNRGQFYSPSRMQEQNQGKYFFAKPKVKFTYL